MQTVLFMGFNIPAFIAIPVAFLVWVLVLLSLKKIVFLTIVRFTRKTSNKIDDILIHSLSFPLSILIFSSGGFVVLHMMAEEATSKMTTNFHMFFKVVTILAIIIFFDRLVGALIRHYSEKVEILRASDAIAQGIARIIVYSIGLLIILESFGISVTPLIASLGIGSLAVALALQSTFENLFAGLQIIVDKPVQVGHFVQLESGEEGYVERIGWRSTWIKMLRNNVIVVPNKTLVSSRIVNYYYPDTELVVIVPVGVHYNSDLEKVERITIEVAKETLKECIGGVHDFQPVIRYHTFGDSSINFNVILRAKEFQESHIIKHDFIKRLHKRYAKEGITIPYPIRAINYEQEKIQERK